MDLLLKIFLINIIVLYGICECRQTSTTTTTTISSSSSSSLPLKLNEEIPLLKSEQDAILRCRNKCLYKILKGSQIVPKLQDCIDNSNCYMCWDYCQALILAETTLSKSMCSDRIYCTEGCIIACKYHRIKTFNKLIATLSSNTV